MEQSSMSKRQTLKTDDFDFLELDSQKLTQELNVLLDKAGAETEAFFANLPSVELESVQEMHARHAVEGRLLREAGLEYLRKKVSRGKPQRAYRAA